MKPVNHALDRLFRAAIQAPGKGQDHPSAALEAKILANWQHRSRGEESIVLLSLFRRGVAIAAVVAAVTVLLTLRGDDTQLPAMDSMVLDSVSELSLLP
jgi:hypothetical protein